MIAIISAMEEELSVILDALDDVQKIPYANLIFYKAKYKKRDLVLVKSGIGMINVSIATTLLIEKFKATKIIFSGVAGSLDENINCLDLVIGTAFVEYDFDVTYFGYELGQRAGTNKRDIMANDEMINISKKIDQNVNYGLIASADKFVSTYEQKKYLKETFNAKLCDMESAALAHVCEILNIPFLVIRAISDSYNKESNMEYNEFMQKAAIKSKNFLMKLLEELI